MEDFVLFGLPVVATIVGMIIFNSRRTAIVSAIAVSELAFLAYVAQDRTGWGGAIFLGFSPVIIGTCLLVAMIGHVFAAFSKRDMVMLGTCAAVHLAITNLVFEWSYRITFAETPIASPPIVLNLVDAAKKAFGFPVIWGFSGLFNEPLQNYPTARFLILATINSIFIAFGCVVAMRRLKKSRLVDGAAP